MAGGSGAARIAGIGPLLSGSTIATTVVKGANAVFLETLTNCET